MTRVIEVIVSPTGETKLETKGFAGSSCRDASKYLEEALGQRASEQTTAELHSQQTNQHSAQENA